jgi:hypothetical protein
MDLYTYARIIFLAGFAGQGVSIRTLLLKLEGGTVREIEGRTDRERGAKREGGI